MARRDRDTDREHWEFGSEPEQAIPPPSQQRPKLIDLRFVIDLVVTRFYVVLMVGKDQRDQKRGHRVRGLTKAGNTLAAVLLLLSANLAISAFIVLSLYLIKSMLGINLMPRHLTEYLKAFMQS